MEIATLDTVIKAISSIEYKDVDTAGSAFWQQLVNNVKSINSYIRVVYDVQTRRVCLGAEWNPLGNNTVALQCNGVILKLSLDEESGNTVVTIMAKPPNGMLPRCPTDVIMSRKYKAYPVVDGTTVTFYYDDGWCIGSTHGIDLSNNRWFSTKTYRDAINECFAAHKTSWNDLDVNHYYTVVFTHPEFHATATEPRMWLLASGSPIAILGENNSGIAVTIPGVPDQQPIPAYTNKERNDLAHKIINCTKPTQIMSYIARDDDPAPFGYILREGTLNYFIESATMKYIRQQMYTMPKGVKNITCENRLRYVITRAWLTNDTRFIKVLPRYTEYFAELNRLLDVVMYKCIQALTTKHLYECVLREAESGKNDETTAAAKIAIALINRIPSVNMSAPNVEKIVHDSIVQPENIAAWMSI